MKISKSLLQAIAVGLTLGAATSSRSIIEPLTKKEETHNCDQSCEEGCTTPTKGDTYDCPACGIG